MDEIGGAADGDHTYDHTLPIDQLNVLDDGKDSLYDQYEREPIATDSEIRSLADQVCFRRLGCNYIKQLHPCNC